MQDSAASSSAVAAGEVSAGLPLSGRKVLVAVSGGIACHKAATLVSRLVQGGAAVRVIMTRAATRFVTPLTFQALSGQSVLTSIWQADDRPDSQHIGLARWCELMVIAPATAHTIARIAAGLCDDLVCLTAAALPRAAAGSDHAGTPATPVLLAPAMNADMWHNPIVQRNLGVLRDTLGYRIIGPESGWQACRTLGVGRMSEPEQILAAAAALLAALPASRA